MRRTKFILFTLVAVMMFMIVTYAADGEETGGGTSAAETDPVETDPVETEPVETEPEPTTVSYTVTFIVGDETATVTVEAPEGEAASIPAESIPTEDADGSAVIRWYYSDLSAAVEPESLDVTGDVTLTAWFAPSLISEHSAYMEGYDNGKFGPDDALTRAEAAQILYNLLSDKSMGAFPYIYTDVTEGSWYYTAVTTVASLGLLDCGGGEFGPDVIITRAEFVSIVTRLSASIEAELPFTDVDESSPYYDAICTAYALGWVNGVSADKFSPDGSLTRAEVVTIFNRIMNREADADVIKSGDGLRSFSDVASSAWYYAAVMEATIDHAADTTGTAETWTSYTHAYTVKFIVNGTTTSYNIYPGDELLTSYIPTKSSSGKAISRWVITGTNTFADPYTDELTASISYTAWFSPSLITDHTAYIEGYDDGTFRPDKSLTKAEACQMLYSLLSSKSRGSYACTYTDVKSGSWYYEAITTLASLNIITCGGGKYNPDATITRGEFVEMISRLTTLSHSDNSFTDVDKSNAYYYAISTATEKGWIVGTGSGKFEPNSALTRAQAVTIFNRIMNRTGDSSAIKAMDSRYTFSDLPSTHWAYVAVMEAATSHVYTVSGSTETWSSYSHATSISADWESSDSVVAAADILTSYSCVYSGDYTQNYNVDYSTSAKEAYVNSKGYSSSTDYLIWVSLACQKIYIFKGSTGNWKLYDTYICGTGAPGTDTPVGVTYITYKQSGWYTSSYTCLKVVRFYPGSGYAFHSRLYYPNTSTLKEAGIGYPISHGCIRMLTPDVTFIHQNVPVNTTVVIY